MLHSKYTALCNTSSDINEHLPTLFKYASECNHVTECGVRTAVSSYAFGSALVGRENTYLIQVDPQTHPNIQAFQSQCVAEGLKSKFYQMSDLDCPLEETDLLFIDTWHIYGHLKRELARWHPYVRKYIIMHDTIVDGVVGETIRCGWDAVQQSKESGIPVDEIRKGLKPAIYEFLAEHPEWIVDSEYINNNGLTILRRR
jgi:cephalosporin hydroxylase